MENDRESSREEQLGKIYSQLVQIKWLVVLLVLLTAGFHVTPSQLAWEIAFGVLVTVVVVAVVYVLLWLAGVLLQWRVGGRSQRMEEALLREADDLRRQCRESGSEVGGEQ